MRVTLHPSTKSTQAHNQAKRWIDSCCKSHSRCERPRGSLSLPTRLVRVEQVFEEKGVSQSARLCDSIWLPTKTPYLTLSHSWGSRKFLTLSLDNIHAFHVSIPVDNLSRTFQDALFATAALGFEYIWIDSLCIVQDSLQDWEKESKTMGHVYRNSVCNLTSSAFGSEEDGLFPAQRVYDPVPPVTTVEGWEFGSLAFIDQSYAIMEAEPWQLIRRAPLFRRAWVLQEQLLDRHPPRSRTQTR
jgi:hypothetical protein